LFHYLLWQDVAKEAVSVDEHWDLYVEANQAFARKVADIYTPGDLIWIHDYHLLLVPGMLRKLFPDATIGLFVHTPFPSSEIFRCLPSTLLFDSLPLSLRPGPMNPGRKEVLEGMLGANLVCFQV
jgi:trehalose 6-phosphate synthase/phosphatase